MLLDDGVCSGYVRSSTFSRVWINREKTPARRQLNRGKCIFPFHRSRLRIWSSETGSAIPSRARLFILHAQTKSGSCSRDSPISATALTFTVNRHYWMSVPNLSSHAIAYRWRSLPKIHWHGASSPQGSPRNRCCLFRLLHGPRFCAPFFFNAHYWYAVDICDTENISGVWFAVEQGIRAG